ncbi:Flp family type IVb pilin [Phycicoccus sp. BSK3Z-2]|uniref:Flp family type IVb pilin n=1 Tax=Phycicoccus avicenniae TaxID=2828860 RepID=A0A941DBF3_9MICO|nr:Flp family type IVb pilin [Phycicoccus avicenniae]MBR7743912.1 Flp family type IVb pilin [Phycicoccus avicenniae]
MNRMRVHKSLEYGATAAEYALLVALVAAVIIGSVIVLGQGVIGLFSSISGRF